MPLAPGESREQGEPGEPGEPGEGERLVTVVLCDAAGAPLGQLEPLMVRPQFWPEVAEIVDAVSERHRLDVTVLRLLTTSGGYAGGRVGYLAQLHSGLPPALGPVAQALATAVTADPAHRQWWAEPDGLADLPTWVDDVLARVGRRRTGPLRQRKSWNLSLLMTAATDRGDVWLKATPPFLADEGSVIARAASRAPDLVPAVLGHDSDRRLILMDHVPGEDQWGLADDDVIDAMVSRIVALQLATADDVEHLVALGALDLRPSALPRWVEEAVSRPETRATLAVASELVAVERLVAGLPARLARVAECGLPDTLVHGDLHPGNWRRDGDRLTLLDWGDVSVGNPVFDVRAFVERLDGADLQERTRARWANAWQKAVPGSDPGRAADLMAPVAELTAAAAYQRFLDHIEQTERAYHEHDPVDRFRAAVAVSVTG